MGHARRGQVLANTLGMSILATGTLETGKIVPYDLRIASRLKRTELTIRGEAEEFSRLVAGDIRALLVQNTSNAIDSRFLAYVLERTGGVTGRVVDRLRRAAIHATTMRCQRMGLQLRQWVGARRPTIIRQPAWFVAGQESTTLLYLGNRLQNPEKSTAWMEHVEPLGGQCRDISPPRFWPSWDARV